MIIALTGTPGTGKTTVSRELDGRGLKTVSLHDYLSERGFLGDFDADCDSYDVDIEAASDAVIPLLDSDETVILEGHLSHLLPCDMIIVLRCNPMKIKERLEFRDYDDSKVLENMEAEALDIILVESLDTGRDVYEVDCSNLTVTEAAEAVMSIIDGEGDKYLPGNIDWSEELLKWC